MDARSTARAHHQIGSAGGIGHAATSLCFKIQIWRNQSSFPTYDELVARYHKALDGMTAAAPKEFSPEAVAYSERKKKFSAYKKVVAKLAKVAEKCSDHDLDYYVVPHPLMGRVTLREILFFSIYHVQHHHKITEEIIKHHK